MNLEILSKEVQQFINENLTTDVHKILLRQSPFLNVSPKELVEQIEAKVKSKKKLPTWFSTDNIIYPNKLNLSQSSSEQTAFYKASLVKGDSVVDLTGGLGIDCFGFSKKTRSVVHVEQNKSLSRIAAHNFKKLGIPNIECVNEDSISFLKNSLTSFDWIYIDPSRRDRENKKVYYLTDCEPDVTTQIDFFLSKAPNILIKTGPLLDLSIGLKQLKNVKEIHIVALSNEVKEILWILEKDFIKEPLLKTVNFQNSGAQYFECRPSDEQEAVATYSSPQEYIYEPNAAILKSGAFKYVGNHYKLDKLHPNSHLYTTPVVIPFPGRIFRVENSCDYANKAFKRLKISKANVTVRNFPDSVAKVRKKLRIQDGGEKFIFCTTDLEQQPILLVCTKG